MLARLFLKMSTGVLWHSLENVLVFTKKLRFAGLEETGSVIKETDVNEDAIFILIILLNRFITRYMKNEADLGLVDHFLSKNSKIKGHNFFFVCNCKLHFPVFFFISS